MSEEKTASASCYDLTPVLCQHLDRHLGLVLIEHLRHLPEKVSGYSQSSTQQAYLTVLKQSALLDLYEEQYIILTGNKDIPNAADVAKEKERISTSLDSLYSICRPLLETLESEAVSNELSSTETLQERLDIVGKNTTVTSEILDALFAYAKLNFDIGQYEFSVGLLEVYRSLSNQEDKKFLALWGELAGEILIGNWHSAYKTIALLKDSIESMFLTDRYFQMKYRTWLAHWSLFVLFALDNGSLLIDLFLQDKFINAIQTGSQHLLRYLVAAVVMNRTRKASSLKSIISEIRRVLLAEAHSYSDPVTCFFQALYIDHDFELALQSLRNSEKVIQSDYFLRRYLDDFKQEASQFFFEIYSRVHKTIDIHLIDSIFEGKEEGQKWVADLVKNARLDAKIDSNAYQVVMSATSPSLYQRVIDKTKILTHNTSQLMVALDRRYSSLGQD